MIKKSSVFLFSGKDEAMKQCKDCEFYSTGDDGRRRFLCDPFENIIEPECVGKWQLMRLDMLVSLIEEQNRGNRKIAPIQEKLIRYVEREIEEMEEGEDWKYPQDEDEPDDFF